MLTRVLMICALLAPLTAHAEMYEVHMLNRGERGPMPFEPDYLHLQPGDSIKFLATTPGHNAASMRGFIPEGAEPFRGNINEEIEVVFDVPGFYGIQCDPHLSLAMIMLVRVGDVPFSELQLPDGLPRRAQARFEEIIAEATQLSE